MSDDIFREVDEELRHDRMQKLAQRYGGLVIAGALGIVAATAAWVGWQHWRGNRDQAATSQFDAALTAAAQGPESGLPALNRFAEGAPTADMGTLARLEAAALLTRSDRRSEAIQIYEAIAADAGADPALRDLATLLSVTRQVDSGDIATLSGRLTRLEAPDNPWRFSARELAGLLAARAGDRAKAHTLFQQLAEDALAPPGIRGRAADLAAYYGRSG